MSRAFLPILAALALGACASPSQPWELAYDPSHPGNPLWPTECRQDLTNHPGVKPVKIVMVPHDQMKWLGRSRGRTRVAQYSFRTMTVHLDANLTGYALAHAKHHELCHGLTGRNWHG